MQLPKRLIVGPYVFSVTERDLDGVDDGGVTIVDRQTITVASGMADDRRAEVLLHEALHAVWAISGIRKKIPEEHVVSRIAPALLDTLRRNPALVRFLIGA